MAIVAAELWMTAVRSIAQIAILTTPKKLSVDIEVKMFARSGLDLIGATPLDMK